MYTILLFQVYILILMKHSCLDIRKLTCTGMREVFHSKFNTDYLSLLNNPMPSLDKKAGHRSCLLKEES